MKRKTSLTVERLEMRSLLSGLTYSLTTNQSVYQVGQTVQMTFSETNTSGAPLTIGFMEPGFVVRQNGTVVFSEIIPFVISSRTLQPGQSITETRSWNGESLGTSPTVLTGEFAVTNYDAPTGRSATFEIDPAPSPGQPVAPPDPPPAGLAPTQPPTTTPTQPPTTTPTQPIVTEPAPPAVPVSSPISVTVTTDHASYKTGRPVRITLTLKNVSKNDVALTSDSKTDGVTILDGTTLIWHSGKINSAKTRTLHAGQSVRLSLIWNGKAHQPGLKNLAASLYTIQVIDGGYAGTGTFQIG
jgi:hypothetical protein